MPTENTSNTEATGTTTAETAGSTTAGQQQTTPEPGGNGTPPEASTPTEPVKLPDDHPLVKTLAANKDKLSTQATELQELRAKSAQVTRLEEELAKRPSTEAITTLQTRYDRLEGFLQAVGGPLGKALDSRSFTRDLFESDKDIATLVKDWNKANPSATSAALASTAGASGTKVDPNTLLRAAYNGGN